MGLLVSKARLAEAGAAVTGPAEGLRFLGCEGGAMAETRTNDPRGLAAGFASYALWAVFPLYFDVLRAVGALEIVAHRIVWSLLFCVIGVTLTRQWGLVKDLGRDKGLIGRLAVAGVLVSFNWLIYVWAVVHGQTVDAALGYFINPLVTVALGLIVLRERLRRPQYIALAVGLVAVVVIVVGLGRVPWVGLGLALTFGFYALMKNRVGTRATPLVGLGCETLVMAPLSLIYIGYLEAGGDGFFAGHGGWYTAGLAATGVITALPLLFFAYGAGRLPLATMGLIQYVAPIGQFLIGVLVFHEAMPPARWAGFALVWVALVILGADGLRAARRRVTPAS
jgi:chloramphenicol-sensitive protein RarD